MRDEGGFLLIELMVALLVLAIVAGPLLSLLVLGVETVQRAGEHTVAVNLAREAMEEAKAAGYYGAVCFVEDEVDEFGGVRREVVVARAAFAGEGVKLKEVVVRVMWQEGGLEREVRLVTFLGGR